MESLERLYRCDFLSNGPGTVARQLPGLRLKPTGAACADVTL